MFGYQTWRTRTDVQEQEPWSPGRNTDWGYSYHAKKKPGLFDCKDEVKILFLYLFTHSGNQYQMMRALVNSCALLRLTVMIFLGFPEVPEAFEDNEIKLSHSITVHSYKTYLLITHSGESPALPVVNRHVSIAVVGTDWTAGFTVVLERRSRKVMHFITVFKVKIVRWKEKD